MKKKSIQELRKSSSETKSNCASGFHLEDKSLCYVKDVAEDEVDSCKQSKHTLPKVSSSWATAPVNGFMPFPHPNHYVFTSPFSYGLNANAHFMQHGALQHLIRPPINHGCLPVFHSVASTNAGASRKMPSGYFSKLETLGVYGCGKLRNLMSPSVARLRTLRIFECESIDEVITEEEQQGEGIVTLFPLLEQLTLLELPKLQHSFLTKHALEFPFLRNVWIDDCPEMKTFIQPEICVSTPNLEIFEAKVDDLNKWIQQELIARQGDTDDNPYLSILYD